MNKAQSLSVINRGLIWLALGVMAVAILASCVTEDDLTPDQRAYQLDRELMCPVCDGQTIDQSHAQIAVDMKEVVREKIAAGETNQEIRDYFVARYGEIVLASPDASGFNLIVWLMPVVIIGGGALAVVWVLKNMRSENKADTGSRNVTLADRQLEPYLAKVDSELGLRQSELTQNPGQISQKNGND